jgi:hypothetical protein
MPKVGKVDAYIKIAKLIEIGNRELAKELTRAMVDATRSDNNNVDCCYHSEIQFDENATVYSFFKKADEVIEQAKHLA